MQTVGELLKEKNIDPKKDDTLSSWIVRQKIIPGMKIELWRNGKQTITAEEDANLRGKPRKFKTRIEIRDIAK